VSDDAAAFDGPARRRTRWDIRREVGAAGDYHSAKGRFFAVGDQVNLPPPLPLGSVWTVIAVEPPQTEGYDGTLVLEPASPRVNTKKPST
jgi:hypothetical protein